MQRLELQIQRDDDLARLAEIDDQIDHLTRERLDALGRLDDAREQLWPVNPRHKGRRPPSTAESPVPPAQPDARGVAGRALRALARSILRQHGPRTLRSLHTWIHHYGYEIDSPWPTKRLADAMGYEVRLGRLQR